MRGFSLVELSIVLVILGLLTGGILAGQSLIRAAELRSVSTESQRYTSAVYAFRDKYFALPGDFRDATKFWGLQVAGSGCVSNHGLTTASTPGACDGNGNGIPAYSAAVSQTGEVWQVWRQLALAGLIEGNYTGIAGSNHVTDALFGTNLPASRLANGGWSLKAENAVIDGSLPGATDFTNYFGTYFIFGAKTPNSFNHAPIMKPEEVWNLDTKFDDGKPGTGKFLAHSRDQCANATAHNDYAATYRLDVNSIVCKFYILL